MIFVVAKNTITSLNRVADLKVPKSNETFDVPTEECLSKCVQQFSKVYDEQFGGFSTAPKFPQPTILNFLFHVYSKDKNSERGKKCLKMCLHTLKKIAYGGIHDHVNTGFARYSVDGRWHVPHFEKMLYDQGQLIVSYCDAYVLSRDEFYAAVVDDIANYVCRDLSDSSGGFYGAEDADSYPYLNAPHKQEGAFCVWEWDEINNILDGTTDNVSHQELFRYHFNIKEGGNVSPAQDPHGELKNKNVLVVFGSNEETAEKFNITVDKVKHIVSKCTQNLYEERLKRPKPHVDTKMVTSWNGLMISGLAKAGFVLKKEMYIKRAVDAANFVRKCMFNEESGTLLRCCYKGDENVVQM